MLRLAALDPADADPTAAWRGTAVHAVLESWMKEDECDPERLRPRAEALLDDPGVHPMLRALWQPRLMEAIDFIAAEMAQGRANGRRPMLAEKDGKTEIAGIELHGIADRIDRCGDEGLAIVDYKTGKPPSLAAVREGFSLQLGLLGLIAERGGYDGITGQAKQFEYWSLSKNNRGAFGYVESPCDPKRRDYLPADEFVDRAVAQFEGAARMWLTGDEPFTAKLHPDYAPYAEYDQLMRRDEWYGRD